MRYFIPTGVFILLYCFFNFSSESSGSRELASAKTKELNPIIGQMSLIKGQVFIIREDKIEAKETMDIYEKDSIVTLDKSFARISMKDKSVFSIGSNSEIQLNKYKIAKEDERNISIELITGMLRSHFVNKNKKGKMDVRGAGVVFGVRGTEFITIVEKDSVELILLEGLVEVKRLKESRTQMMRAQEKIMITPLYNYETPKTMSEEEHNYYNKFILVDTDNSSSFFSTQQDSLLKSSSVKSPTESSQFSKARSKIHTMSQSELTKLLTDGKMSFTEKKQLVHASSSTNKTELLKYLDKVENRNRYINNVLNKVTNMEAFNKLSPEAQERIIKLNNKNTIDQVQELIAQDKAAVLITPDKKVVFFEEFPELKALLPTNDKGEVLGIHVDENLVPIVTASLKETSIALIEEIANISIPVVNDLGKIVLIPVLNEIEQTSIIPTSAADGQAAGVSAKLLEKIPEILDNTVRGLASEETKDGLITQIVKPVVNEVVTPTVKEVVAPVVKPLGKLLGR